MIEEFVQLELCEQSVNSVRTITRCFPTMETAITLNHFVELHSQALRFLTKQDATIESWLACRDQCSRQVSSLANLWPRLELFATASNTCSPPSAGTSADAGAGFASSQAFDALGVLCALDAGAAPGLGVGSELLSLCADQLAAVLRNLAQLSGTLTARAAEAHETVTALAAAVAEAALPPELLVRVPPLPGDQAARAPPLPMTIADALALLRTQAQLVADESARLAGLLAAATTASTTWTAAGNGSQHCVSTTDVVAQAAAAASETVSEGHWELGTRLGAALAAAATGSVGRGGGNGGAGGFEFAHSDTQGAQTGVLRLQPARTGTRTEPAPLGVLPELPAHWAGNGVAVARLAEGRKLVTAATKKPRQ